MCSEIPRLRRIAAPAVNHRRRSWSIQLDLFYEVHFSIFHIPRLWHFTANYRRRQWSVHLFVHKLHFSIVHLYLGSIAVFAVNYCGCDELPHLRLITAVAVIATKQPHKLEGPSLHLKAQSTPDKAISPSSWRSKPKFTALTNHNPSYSSKTSKKFQRNTIFSKIRLRRALKVYII